MIHEAEIMLVVGILTVKDCSFSGILILCYKSDRLPFIFYVHEQHGAWISVTVASNKATAQQESFGLRFW